MYKFIFLSCLLFSTNSILAQTKTNGSAGLPIEVNFSDTTIPDYKADLKSVDKQPLPSSDYGDKKAELHRKRLELRAKEQGKKKSSEANEVYPNIVNQYEGNLANGGPSDNDIAVSDGEMIASGVNTNIAIYNESGTLLQSKSLTQLASQVGSFNQMSDPRFIYDAQRDRFIFTCFHGSHSTNNTILVGFSKTNNPSGLWNFYKIKGAPFPDSTWSDYPILAVNGSDFFMTFNLVKDNIHWSVGFNQSVIWQIDKESGYNGDTLKYTLWSDIKHNGRRLRNICPAKPQTFEKNQQMYFLTLRNVDASNDSIFLTHINNSYASGNAQISTKLLKSPVQYGFPPNAIQAKNSSGITQQLMTNDARVLAAIYENDYIHFGSNTINTNYTNAGVMLGTIKNVSKPTPTVTAKIFSTANLEYGYPSMTQIDDTTIKHRVLYTMSHCVTDSFPGMSMIYQNTLGEFSPIYRIKNGSSNIDNFADSIERWGDYSNAQRVYANPSLAYMVGSYGEVNRMKTWIAKVEINDPVLPPPPVSITEGSNSPSQIFPNPSSTFFQANFYLTQSEVLRFSIYDISGKLVVHLLETKGHAGQNEFRFDSSPLAKGQYHLHIIGEKGTNIKEKIVKE